MFRRVGGPSEWGTCWGGGARGAGGCPPGRADGPGYGMGDGRRCVCVVGWGAGPDRGISHLEEGIDSNPVVHRRFKSAADVVVI